MLDHSLGTLLDLQLDQLSVYELDDGLVQERVISLDAPKAC